MKIQLIKFNADKRQHPRIPSVIVLNYNSCWMVAIVEIKVSFIDECRDSIIKNCQEDSRKIRALAINQYTTNKIIVTTFIKSS